LESVGVAKNELLSPREFIKEYAIRSLVCCFSGGKRARAKALVSEEITFAQAVRISQLSPKEGKLSLYYVNYQ